MRGLRRGDAALHVHEVAPRVGTKHARRDERVRHQKGAVARKVAVCPKGDLCACVRVCMCVLPKQHASIGYRRRRE